jgi:Zn-dependent protease with chaperone function
MSTPVMKAVSAAMLCLAALSGGRAQLLTLRPMEPQAWVQVHLETTGEASISVWPEGEGLDLAPMAKAALHCRGEVNPDPLDSRTIRCSQALSRDGLTLEGVVDLAPVARQFDLSKGIQLRLNSPRLGFESVSVPVEEQGGVTRQNLMARFPAGDIPPPIHFRFGYNPEQVTAIFLPLLALALAIFLIAALLSRVGLAGLSRSIILLNTILWMGAASELKSGALVHILLFGNPLANLAALLVEFWPPLFCVAAGVALGRGKVDGWNPIEKFREISGGFAVIPLVVTCAVGALPPTMNNDWITVVLWLAAAPLYVLVRRQWIRKTAGASLLLLKSGALKERISYMAARVGRPQIKAYISFSARSQAAAAFTLPGKNIYLTASLVRSLSKREVDAVAAHELSHTGIPGRGQWMALAFAMLLFEFPLRELLFTGIMGWCVAMLIPLTIFFVSLRKTRRSEFAADAGAVALCGDPRAMISSLARISRNNKSPLEWNAAVEWFAPHPSTLKRIRALAAASKIDASELEALCGNDQPGEHYEIPQETSDEAIFTLQWQKTNGGIYGWAVLFSCSGAGLLVARLLMAFPGAGVVSLLAGIALGCVLTKGFAATLMASNYARLRRKLETRLGVSGQLVGLAIDSKPRLYNSFRFSDAGLLRFEGGRLCYQSERIMIALNPADVVEVSMVAASPSNWFRQQPMVRFRLPESGDVSAFILHPVTWLPSQGRLLRYLERWRVEQTSQEPTSISGFNAIAGQPFRNPAITAVARAFLVSGGVTLVTAISAAVFLQAEWWYVGYAIAVTACAHTFIFLPAMLYRRVAPSPKPSPTTGAKS